MGTMHWRGHTRHLAVAVAGTSVILALLFAPPASSFGAATAAGGSTVLDGFFEPDALAVSGHDLFVANGPAKPANGGSIGNTVSELDTSTGAILRVISGPAYRFDYPTDMEVSGHDLYVANGGTFGNEGSLTELNASTGALVRVISGASYKFAGPAAMALSGPHLFVANYGGSSLTELNASTGALMRVISGASYKFAGPAAMALSGPHLFVANYGGSSLTELNASTGALVRVISGAAYKFGRPRAMAVSGHDLFVANGVGGIGNDGFVTELNASTGSAIRMISGRPYQFDNPVALALSGHNLFVANDAAAIVNGDTVYGGSLTELNASTGALVRVVSGTVYELSSPDGMSLSGNDLFVANMADGTVTKLDISGGVPVSVTTTTTTTTTQSAVTTIPAATTTTGVASPTCTGPCRFTFPQDDQNGFASAALDSVTQNVNCPDPGNCDVTAGQQVDDVSLTMCAGSSGVTDAGSAIGNFSLSLADGTQADQDSVTEDSNVPTGFGNYGTLDPDQCITGDIYFDATSGTNWTTLDFSYTSADFSTDLDYLWNA